MDGSVFIDGILLNEAYLDPHVQTHPELEMVLKEEEYFCMGDNRRSSRDRRKAGVFPKEYIIGHAIFGFAPLDKFEGLE